MGTIWKKKKQRRKKEEKKERNNERKSLTLTGPLMEGLEQKLWCTNLSEA